jgi:glucokinase
MATGGESERFFMGIDLDRAEIKGALVASSGEVARDLSVKIDLATPGAVLAQLIELVRNLLDFGRPVEGIGIGVPGLVNRKTGRVEMLPNLPELSGSDIVSEVAHATGLPVTLDNDANAAAYGELQVGIARGLRDLFCVWIGSGIGAGIIIDGRIYRGATGFAGEFGHMTIDPEGLECACGNIGCLETVASAPNIVRRTRERLYRDRTSSLSRLALPRDRELTVEDIVHEAREGDQMAQVMLERTGMFLGIALATVVNLLNVEMITLGGQVMEAGDLILKPAIDEVRRRAFPPSFNNCRITIAKLGRLAGVIGAALLARDSLAD